MARKEALYGVWNMMKQRCSNPKTSGFKYWGGRGISVCRKWLLHYEDFKEWAISNGYKNGLSLDRINNDGDYHPSNCRWVNRYIQNRNSRHCHLITLMNETKSVSEWLEDKRCQVTCSGFYRRLRKGWEFDKAILTPLLR